MAPRTNKPLHDDKTKRLIGASQLLNRLTSHAKGEIEMSPTQVAAAKIVIAKSIPDLRSMELTGSGGAPVRVDILEGIDLKKISDDDLTSLVLMLDRLSAKAVPLLGLDVTQAHTNVLKGE